MKHSPVESSKEETNPPQMSRIQPRGEPHKNFLPANKMKYFEFLEESNKTLKLEMANIRNSAET